jgi:hypothetical protein
LKNNTPTLLRIESPPVQTNWRDPSPTCKAKVLLKWPNGLSIARGDDLPHFSN